MATKIEQVEYSWNAFTGCTKISAGCKHCYAEIMHRRLTAMGLEKYKYDFNTIRFWPPSLSEPHKIKKPSMIFVNSMSDTFHESHSFADIDKIFSVMSDCDRHIYQVYTKRPERVLQFFKWKNKQATLLCGRKTKWVPKENIWFIVTVENQKQADIRIPQLIKIKSRVKGISVEPMLNQIDISLWLYSGYLEEPFNDVVNWVICGGESGPKARPLHPDWVRNLQRQCEETNTPFFFKQWGEWQPITTTDGRQILPFLDYIPAFKLGFKRTGKKNAGYLLDGKEYRQFPKF